MAGYLDYYQRTIDAYTHGVKLVLGPTGLGKSSSIPEVIHNNPDGKFIYMANRKEASIIQISTSSPWKKRAHKGTSASLHLQCFARSTSSVLIPSISTRPSALSSWRHGEVI